MSHGQTEPFEVEGTWWRPDGVERVEATKPPNAPSSTMGLDEGLRLLNAENDPLLGRDAAHPCYGTLRFAPTETFRLNLPGASDRVFDDVDRGHFVVHGYTSNGHACSLLGCFTSNTSVEGRGYTSAKLVGHLFVDGAHLLQASDLLFSEAEIRLAGLRDFFAAALPTAAGEAGGDATSE